MQNLLSSLLDEGWAYDPVYLPDFNSDHLPMTLVAMSAMGAPPADLLQFQQSYRQRLRPVQPAPPLTSLHQGRGERGAFASLRPLVMADIRQSSAETVIRRHLPELLPSLATGAFHPLIRLGAAISAQHEGEIASALAYWMTSPFNPPLQPRIENRSLREVLLEDEDVGIPPGPFARGLYQLVREGQYPAPVDTSLEECASTALEIYRGTRNFFALHLVTGTHAARVCSAYADMQRVTDSLTAGVRAAYLILGVPAFAQSQRAPEAIDDEHNLKYVYACSEEYRCWKDERYLEEIKAFKAAGLVPDWVRMPDA